MLEGDLKEFSNNIVMAQAEKLGLWTVLSCLELKYTAWKYFLPLQNANSALVFDASLGLDSISLSRHVSKIVSVVFDYRLALFLTSRFKEYSNIDVILVSSKSDLPFALESFDLVVVRDIKILDGKETRISNKMSCIDELKELINIKGTFLFGFNQKAISLRKADSELSLNEVGIGTCAKARRYIRRNNLFIREIVHCLPNQYRMNEILIDSLSLESNAHGNYLKEKLKSIALQYCLPIFKFSDLFIVEKGIDFQNESLLSMVLLGVKQNLCLNSDKFKVRTIKIVSPNTLLCIVDHENHGMIIRLPMDEESTMRAESQKKVLNSLRKKAEHYNSFFPRQLARLSLEGQDVYIEERLNGIIISEILDSYDKYEVSAVEWLVKFQSITRKDIVFDKKQIEEFVSIPLQRLQKFITKEPEFLIVQSLNDLLYKQLFNQRISLVCMHGDYKIENILFDQENFNVSGVIDWDLAQMNGLPLLDLLYLLVYSHKLRNPGLSISRIFLEIIKNQELSGTEKKYIDNYCETLAIDSSLLQVFCILGWLYHVVYRFGDLMKYYPKWYEENISQVLFELNNILQLNVKKS